MATKVKGLLKGLRYISQIFEEEKEPEMQIGLPTDVKHVAHIGWDGPTVQESPSWMKDYKAPAGGFQSAPLSSLGEPGEDSEIKWVSQDGKRGSKARDLPELPKSTRRQAATDNNASDSPRKKDSSTRSRQSRRRPSKDSSEGGSLRSTRHLQEMSQAGGDSPSRDLPDIPKKTRPRKPKEQDRDGGGSSRSRAKGIKSNGEYVSPFSDSGTDARSTSQCPSSQQSPIPSIEEGGDESRVKCNGY